MKILHINWSGDFGGAETFAYNLAIAQKESGNDVTLSYMSKRSILGVKAENNGIKVIDFNMCCGYDIVGFIKYIRFIEEENCDIIHDHNGPPIVRLSRIFAKHSIFIQHIHGTKWGNKIWEKKSVLLWKQLTSDFVNYWIANSHSTKKIASMKEKISPARISVVHSGINIFGFKPSNYREKIRNELNIPKDDFVIGTVSRLSPPKGIDKFIETARLMQKENGIKFVIVGDGELRAGMEKLVATANLGDRVIFTGARKDIPDILSAFDIFLSTSNWEAFGVALVEAMAVGVPVVAFAVDGVTEVMDKDCGILVPYGEIDKAAEAIRLLKNNSETSKRMGLSGIKRAAQYFDIKEISAKVLKLYSSLSY